MVIMVVVIVWRFISKILQWFQLILGDLYRMRYKSSVTKFVRDLYLFHLVGDLEEHGGDLGFDGI